MSEYFDQILNQSKQASYDMARLTANDRSKILMNISGFLVVRKQEILQANQIDVDRAKQNNLSAPMVNRLILTEAKIDQLAQDVEKIAQMADPLNQELEQWSNATNGLQFSKVTVPIGVIGNGPVFRMR